MSVPGNTQLQLSAEQAMLLDVAREFCRDRSPVAAARELLETEPGFDPDLWKDMVELGWAGIGLPESCGGSALGASALVPVMEAMGRSMVPSPLLSTSVAAQLLLRAAGADRAEAWLADIAAGTAASVAWLENSDWGDESVSMELDAELVLHGAKKFVPDAAAASLLLVPVQHRGELALAVVSTALLGDSALRANTLIDLTKRSADVDFTGVQLTPEDVIAGPAVPAALRDARLIGALLVAAEATGSTAACLDTIVEYLKTRKQFGRLIGSYQALKHPTVEILLEMDSARSFIYHAATLVDEDILDRDAEIACRMAKVQASQVLTFAGDRAVQFHGGMGFTWECDAQLYIRRAQWSRQQFADSLHHRKRLAHLLLD